MAVSFDPEKHMINLKGKKYLPVAGRLVWFRHDHPDWSIVTAPVEINLSPESNKPPYAIFSASILNAEGRVIATATKMEDLRGFPDFIEKAETSALGRALAYCGYGTQFAPELEEGERLADAPQDNRSQSPAQSQPRRQEPVGGQEMPRPVCVACNKNVTPTRQKQCEKMRIYDCCPGCEKAVRQQMRARAAQGQTAMGEVLQ